jgi:hypothetical protein
MKRISYAVVFVVMSAAAAHAAADSAAAGLISSVPPSALENIVLPSPGPAAEIPSTPPQDPSSVSAPAGTRLNGETIQGEYLFKTAKMPELKIILADNAATLIKPDPDGDLVCKGVYKMDADKSLLITDFGDCGGSSFSHTMYLEGQTVESLMAGADVIGSLKMDGDVTPSMPVKIKKVK